MNSTTLHLAISKSQCLHMLFGLTALLFILATLNPQQVFAGDGVFGTHDFVLVGVNIGTNIALDEISPLIGGEASYFFSPKGTIAGFGGYVDFVYDAGLERNRVSIGPEVGWYIFVLDAGIVLEQGEDTVEFGYRVRPLLSVGVVALFVSFGEALGASNSQEFFSEVGVLLKFPISHLWEPI